MGFLGGAVVFLLLIGLDWLLTCGVFWLLCWALTAFGITAIFGWTVSFSLLAATAFWIITGVIRSLFRFFVTVNR